jgi:hypothetical protein
MNSDIKSDKLQRNCADPTKPDQFRPAFNPELDVAKQLGRKGKGVNP